MCDSAWAPDEDDVAVLAVGGHVVLRVIGGQPSVAVFVEPRVLNG
jgi:hypothetical protein